MEHETVKVPVLRISGSDIAEVADSVVREFSLTIMLNGTNLVTILCSPVALEALTAGFLLAQGFIERKEDIGKLWVDMQSSTVHVQTSQPVDIDFKPVIASSGARHKGGTDIWRTGGGNNITITPSQVVVLMEMFVHTSKIFENTGGVHSAALCDTSRIVVFHEDIGRHNAIDKIFGQCLLQGISLKERLVLTSGRVSSEIIYKVAKCDIPILVSKSAPTDKGIALADGFGITLIGFARDDKMNVYTNRWRVTPDRR